MGFSSVKDAVHVLFWNWKAVSKICLHLLMPFPKCSLIWAAMCYWLHVGNHLAHLLCSNNTIPYPRVYCLHVVFESMKHIYLCFDLIMEMRYSGDSLYPILQSAFELYLYHQKRYSARVIGFAFSASLEWHVISALLDLFHCHLHHKEATFY